MKISNVMLLAGVLSCASVACAVPAESEEASATRKYDLTKDYEGTRALVRREVSGNIRAVLVDTATSTVLATVDYDKAKRIVTASCGSESGTLETAEQPLVWHAEIAHQMYEGWKAGPQPEAEPVASPKTNYRVACSNGNACTVSGCTNDCTPIGYCNGSFGQGYHDCCYVHDVCFIENGCSASSWIPFVGSSSCKRCNRNAVSCFAGGYNGYAGCTGGDGECTEQDQRAVTGGELATHSSESSTMEPVAIE